MQTNSQILVRTTDIVLDLLKSQDYFDADNETLIDLIVHALIRAADDEPHIKRMLEAWVSATRQMLHPADVKQLAAQTSNRVELPAGCNRCEIPGTRGTVAGVRYLSHVSITKNGVDASDRCSCRRGDRLRKLDLEHAKAKAAARPVHADVGVLEQFATESPDENS